MRERAGCEAICARSLCWPPGRTVWERGLTASTELHKIEDELAACEEKRLGDPAVYGDEERLARPR
ncbi:MAG: hypothetical protein R2856_09415 [Caldilineaceae bacterium]